MVVLQCVGMCWLVDTCTVRCCADGGVCGGLEMRIDVFMLKVKSENTLTKKENHIEQGKKYCTHHSAHG